MPKKNLNDKGELENFDKNNPAMLEYSERDLRAMIREEIRR